MGDFIRENAICQDCGQAVSIIVHFLNGAESYRQKPLCRNCQDERRRKAREAEIQKHHDELEAQLPAEIEIARKKWVEASGIPPRFAGALFDNFKTSREPEAVKAMRAFYVATKQAGAAANKGMVLSGPYGSGKTHLACALLNLVIDTLEPVSLVQRRFGSEVDWEFSRRPAPCFYVTETALFSLIRQTFRKDATESQEDILASLASVDWLVLDDIGKSRPNNLDFVQGIYYDLVNRIYDSKAGNLIIVTNLSDNELAAHMGGSVESRLCELAEKFLVRTSSADFRRLDVRKAAKLDEARNQVGA